MTASATPRASSPASAPVQARELLTIGRRARTRALPVGRLRAYSLRVSLLEQCQLRCSYCLPGAVRGHTRNERWLRAEDHARLAPLFGARSVTKVRFTGGEPLLRPDVADVVAAWRRALPAANLALTTNGHHLDAHLDPLAEAGLDRVTVHVDTLRDDRYAALMGRGSVSHVIELALVAKARLGEAKLNVVVQRGLNDDEILDFLALSRETGLEVRFIELMNTGSAPSHVERTFLSGREMIAAIAQSRGVRPLPRRNESDPAALFALDDGTVFGVIASDTQPFCASCDRLRLTADGALKGCLYAPEGVPLGEALRRGAPDDELCALLDAGLDEKRSFHPLFAIDRVPFSMADIGG